MASFLKKIWSNKLIRYVFVIISILFIAGGVFNDGLTRAFFSIPFILLLYFSLPFGNKKRIIIFSIVLVVAIFVSIYRYKSPIVYPTIGQEIVTLEDIPINGYSVYDPYFYILGQGRSIDSVLHIPKGQVYHVESIEPPMGLDSCYKFVFSNENGKFKVREPHLDWYSPNEEEKIYLEAGFCSKVRWDYCTQGKFNDNHTKIIYPDVMRSPFIWVGNLMAYPMLPFWVYDWLKS